jgi:hypothetical protein
MDLGFRVLAQKAQYRPATPNFNIVAVGTQAQDPAQGTFRRA